MKKSCVLACAGTFLLSSIMMGLTTGCQKTKPGGYAPAAVTQQEVLAAATFAIQAQEKAMRAKGETAHAKLELIKVVQAQQQVVAGMNYRLTLKVKVDGSEREAEAVVWWQAWRTEAPYELTSWRWR